MPCLARRKDVLVSVAQFAQRVVAGRHGEQRDRLLLHEQPELERVTDQLQVDMGDLHAALRHGADQPLGLEPRDQFADRAERQPGQLDELALRDELPGPDVRAPADAA